MVRRAELKVLGRATARRGDEQRLRKAGGVTLADKKNNEQMDYHVRGQAHSYLFLVYFMT